MPIIVISDALSNSKHCELLYSPIADALFRPKALASKGFLASLFSSFSSLRPNREAARNASPTSPDDARKHSLSALWLLAGQPFLFHVSTWSLLKLALSSRTFVGGDALVRRVAQRWGETATAHFCTPEAVLNPYLSHVRQMSFYIQIRLLIII